MTAWGKAGSQAESGQFCSALRFIGLKYIIFTHRCSVSLRRSVIPGVQVKRNTGLRHSVSAQDETTTEFKTLHNVIIIITSPFMSLSVPSSRTWRLLVSLWQFGFTKSAATSRNQLSHLMTKPAKWPCAQRRLRSAWASAQSGQSLRRLHEESLGP